MTPSNRCQLCLNYRLRGWTRAALVYLVIFLAADLALPSLLYLIFGRSSGGGTVFYQPYGGDFPGSVIFGFSTVIFLFVGGSASFREDFNFLLALNNTRRNQFLSTLPLTALAGVAGLAVSIPVRILEVCVASWINQESIRSGIQAYFQEYAASGPAKVLASLLLFIASFSLAYAFGQAVGSLGYRFGRAFLIPFWICFGCSFILVPIIDDVNPAVRRFFEWFLGQGRALPQLNLSLHLLAFTVLLLALSGAVYRRLPQNA